MKCYALGAQTRSAEVMQAFCNGVGGEFYRHAEAEYEGGDIALWGMLRGAKKLRAKCREAGNNYYAVDHAYIGRERFFRVTRNGFQQTEVFDAPKERFLALKDRYQIDLKEWKTGGRYVLLALSSPMNYEYFDNVGWQGVTTYQIRRHTDRKIIERPKGCRERLQDQLAQAWCVVTHASIVAVDAVIAGVPVFMTGPSIARPMGLSDLSRIETPAHPERNRWLYSLAWAQFTISEMTKGVPKRWLDENAVDYDHYGL